MSLLIEDESARVSDDLFLACKPMIAISQGKHVLMSTPFGRRGHFFEMWENGGPSWERIRTPATECPRIPPSFLEEERRAMPLLWYQSEYECLFTDVDGAVFRHDDIIAALSGDVEPITFSRSQSRMEDACDDLYRSG